MGDNFVLKGKDCLYLFFINHAIHGSEHVVSSNGVLYCGSYSFGNVTDKVESIEWMDNGEVLDFVQNDSMLSVNATGYPYGMSTCVRVAKAKIK